jgi:hypothetical protein
MITCPAKSSQRAKKGMPFQEKKGPSAIEEPFDIVVSNLS